MEINRNAPATADGELQIDVGPQTVFAVISAIDQWPSWNPDVKSVRVEGPVQPGTVFRWKRFPSASTVGGDPRNSVEHSGSQVFLTRKRSQVRTLSRPPIRL